MYVANNLFVVMIILLILLGVFSFALFIRRLLINVQVKNENSIELNRKLDKIIELLENKSN
ncbi:DUF4083 family protein [Heyndrickxia sp. NPDC080065]|uniref:DUF4083 family protein n=1 Tax=Heyndrickxia sp. NPDC080065 TaxID=3390568 RepID=UPI003D00829A